MLVRVFGSPCVQNCVGTGRSAASYALPEICLPTDSFDFGNVEEAFDERSYGSGGMRVRTDDADDEDAVD